MKLNKRRCVPCEGGVSKLTNKSAKEFQKHTPKWKIVPETGKNHHLIRVFKFKNFKNALKFVNKVGLISEKENHHPRIALSWGEVVIVLYTHSIDGLHSNDFILASKIDKIDPNAAFIPLKKIKE